MPDDALIRTLCSLEERGWDSLCDGTASAVYGELMTDDGLMVLANGMTMTRAEVTAALEQAPPWSSYQLDDVHLVELSEETAALVYRGTARRDDGSSVVATMSSVYTRRAGAWRLALYQQTPVPDV